MARTREFRIALNPKKGFDVRLSSLSQGEHPVAVASIKNLSRSGFCVVGWDQPRTGGPFAFEIPDPEGGGTLVRGLSEVRWKHDLEAPEQAPLSPDVGMEIKELSPESQLAWLGLLESYIGKLELEDWIERDFPRLQVDLSVLEALAVLKAANKSLGVVINENQRALGLIDMSQALIRCAWEDWPKLSVRELMSTEFQSLNIDAPMPRIIEAFRSSESDYVLVHEQEVYRGILSARPFCRILIEWLDLKSLRMQRDFSESIDRLVHELKSPLAIIQSSNEILSSGLKAPAEYLSQKFPQIIEENCELLNTLIQGLHLENGLSSGTELKEPEFCSLNDLAQKHLQHFQIRAQLKNQHLDCDLEPHTLLVLAEKSKLDQVFHNLLSNALKFSPYGAQIKICTKLRGLEAIVEIHDEGPGVEAADIKAIFKPYQKSKARPTGGELSTGLGLSIVKSIIESLKGRVGFRELKPRGSVFYFALAIARRDLGS